jgi:hypothetical protein
MTDKESGNGFEPELTLFTCNYCAYMAGDTAGALRVQYPANVKLVRLPCTGKIDVRYIGETSGRALESNLRRRCWIRLGWAARGWRYSSCRPVRAQPMP